MTMLRKGTEKDIFNLQKFCLLITFNLIRCFFKIFIYLESEKPEEFFNVNFI